MSVVELLLVLAGVALLLISGILDGISMSKYEFNVLERIERFGNFIRLGSLIATSAIFLTWLVLTHNRNDDLLPHVIMTATTAAVFLGWACYHEQKRLREVAAPWIVRSQSLIGTAGMIVLQTGIILWAVSDHGVVALGVSFGLALFCAIMTLVGSVSGLLWIYLKHVKTGRSTFRRILPGEIDWNAVRRK